MPKLNRPLTFGSLAALMLALFSVRAQAASGLRVGVWIRHSGLAEPEKTADLLASSGVEVGNIMINAYKKDSHSSRPFSTYEAARIIRLARALEQAGIAVDLTTWVMPHEEFITGMGQQIPQLADACRARYIWLDAEEPWNRATKPLPWDAAADAVRVALAPARRPLVLSAISYVSKAKIGPLSRVCHLWSPQAYATGRKGSMDYSTAVSSSLSRWKRRLGEPSQGWIMGLAAYGQPRPAAPAMEKSIEAARKANIGEVCYWSHTALGAREDVAEFVRSI